ncbi:MAG: hypothetical protein MUE42_14815 [Opitutaceae bacterium]|nr:hypothetical protein [Opitutaceae bacterium]
MIHPVGENELIHQDSLNYVPCFVGALKITQAKRVGGQCICNVEDLPALSFGQRGEESDGIVRKPAGIRALTSH